MKELPNFPILTYSDISKEFLKRNVQSFHHATQLIQNMDYGRNSIIDHLTTIFKDNK